MGFPELIVNLAFGQTPAEKSAADFVIKVNILTPAVFYSKKIDKKVKNDKLIAKIVNFW